MYEKDVFSHICGMSVAYKRYFGNGEKAVTLHSVLGNTRLHYDNISIDIIYVTSRGQHSRTNPHHR